MTICGLVYSSIDSGNRVIWLYKCYDLFLSLNASREELNLRKYFRKFLDMTELQSQLKL